MTSRERHERNVEDAWAERERVEARWEMFGKPATPPARPPMDPEVKAAHMKALEEANRNRYNERYDL